MMRGSPKEVKSVTLADVLSARERRAELQKKLIAEYKATVISFTMNVAGPVKNTPLIERAFEYGFQKLRSQLPKDKIFFEHTTTDFCGCEAMIAIGMDAKEAKDICVSIEEESHLGRLFDMDVINTDGDKLDRMTERSCIVCGKAGRGCAAGRIHSVDEIVAVTNKIIIDHFATYDSDRIGRLAAECLIKEVETTPKPGLVDLRNSGSHTDMDVNTFRKSANALIPYFTECVKIGIESGEAPATETFGKLRDAGLRAEAIMYEATDGVNTHKGAIYSMGVILGAVGRLWSVDRPIEDREVLLNEVAAIVSESAVQDLSTANGATAGERLYLARGITGIRGEVASGFSSVTSHALPVYESAIKKGASENDAGVRTLISLISVLDDTNMYHRGGEDGVNFAKEYAENLLSQEFCIDGAIKMDDAFIERRLSPGGAADLLAITYFLYELEKLKK